MTDRAIYTLKADRCELVIDAAHGASLTSFRWRRPDGDWFEILHACPPAQVARTGGSFVMAPFTNRLDAGRFLNPDGSVEVPLNRPEQNMSLHGFSRDRAWQVIEATESTLTLVDDFADEAIPFAYRLAQHIAISPDGAELSLTLTNTADRMLPYGMGFHPWFRKDEETWLSFDAETGFSRDQRGFPTGPVPADKGPDFAHGLDTSKMPWFDGHFSGWASRQAIVEWRRAGISMTLSATGALTNLHVYVPDDQPVLCVEPVSHIPDVHNRRELAGYGDLVWLAAGERIEGSMVLRFA
jgi:aldose 1-epimerase